GPSDHGHWPAGFDSVGSCTPTLRLIPLPPKPGKMPPSQDMLEGATPWSHTFFTTNSLCWPSSGSSSCCMSLGPSEACAPHPRQPSLSLCHSSAPTLTSPHRLRA